MKLYICENISKLQFGDEKPSRVFARRCIADYISQNVDDTGIIFTYGSHGKPFVGSIRIDGANYERPVFFSLSHSADMLICAVADTNVGADCQYHSLDQKRAEPIAERFYSAEEREYLANFDNDRDFLNAFYHIWTRKEAYIKYTGKGLSEGLSSFSTIQNNAPVNSIGSAVFVRSEEQYENYTIAVCVGK